MDLQYGTRHKDKNVIQEHNFLKISNGESTLFLEDVLKQLSVIDNHKDVTLQRTMQEKGKLQVAHYWKPNTSNARWRDGLDIQEWSPLP